MRTDAQLCTSHAVCPIPLGPVCEMCTSGLQILCSCIALIYNPAPFRTRSNRYRHIAPPWSCRIPLHRTLAVSHAVWYVFYRSPSIYSEEESTLIMSSIKADGGQPMQTTSTFHPFPRLSSELRLAIWEMTVEPREVEVRIVKPKPTPGGPPVPLWSHPRHWPGISRAKFEEAMSTMPTSTRGGCKRKRKAWDEWKPYHPYVHLTSSTVPAILHTCGEARNHGLYQQVYLDGEDQPSDDRRYVWLNLKFDLVNIGTWNMAYFLPIATSIKRLKLSRDIPDEFDHEMDLISRFNNAEEVHLVCLDGFIDWGHEVDAVNWPCSKGSLVFSEQAPWIEYGDG